MGWPKRSPWKGLHRISLRWSCNLDRSGGACRRHFEEAAPHGTRRTLHRARLPPQAPPRASGRGDRKHRSQCLRSELYRANPFSFPTALRWQMGHLKVEAVAVAATRPRAAVGVGVRLQVRQQLHLQLKQALGTLPQPCVKTQGRAAPPAQPRLPTPLRPLPQPPSGPSGPSGPSVSPGPAAGLMNLMFADDSQDVSRDAPAPHGTSATPASPKLQSAAEEVSKPKLDTETAPVRNDAPEAPIKLDLTSGEEKLVPERELHLQTLDPLEAPEADTLPGSLNEVGFEPFRVPSEPVADGPVLQTVSFFDMLKGLD